MHQMLCVETNLKVEVEPQLPCSCRTGDSCCRSGWNTSLNRKKFPLLSRRSYFWWSFKGTTCKTWPPVSPVSLVSHAFSCPISRGVLWCWHISMGTFNRDGTGQASQRANFSSHLCSKMSTAYYIIKYRYLHSTTFLFNLCCVPSVNCASEAVSMWLRTPLLHAGPLIQVWGIRWRFVGVWRCAAGMTRLGPAERTL